MTGTIRSRIRKLEQELTLDQDDFTTEVFYVVVQNRQEATALLSVPFGLRVEGIPGNEDDNRFISAQDYLRLVKEQHSELLPDLAIPEPAAVSH
ncbi:MAG: hypothetical protein ACK5D7_16815 [Planctomycetota bacterium]